MKVKLWSNEEPAAEATDCTIQGLPTGGKLLRNGEGKVAFDEEGFATIVGGDQGFLKFACLNQGYVKEIKHEV